jgi:hypothetical protein
MGGKVDGIISGGNAFNGIILVEKSMRIMTRQNYNPSTYKNLANRAKVKAVIIEYKAK